MSMTDHILNEMVEVDEETGMVTVRGLLNTRTGISSEVTFPGSELTADAMKQVLLDTITSLMCPDGIKDLDAELRYWDYGRKIPKTPD